MILFFMCYGVPVVRQVKVRELALCIHRQDEVFLSGVPSLGSGTHAVWAQATMALGIC